MACNFTAPKPGFDLRYSRAFSMMIDSMTSSAKGGEGLGGIHRMEVDQTALVGIIDIQRNGKGEGKLAASYAIGALIQGLGSVNFENYTLFSACAHEYNWQKTRQKIKNPTLNFTKCWISEV